MSDVQRDAKREIDAAAAIRLGLQDLTDDEDAIRDTLEGEIDLATSIRHLMLSIDDDQLISDGCKSRMSDLQERKNRHDKRIESKRTLIQQALAISGWAKHEMDIATVSLRKSPDRLVIEDEVKIPSDFWKPGAPTLDKKALKDACKDGDVAGAYLEAVDHTISIRRK